MKKTGTRGKKKQGIEGEGWKEKGNRERGRNGIEREAEKKRM